MQCIVRELGLIDYQSAWDLQHLLAADVARNASLPVLLLLEHPHTYTFGRSASPENLLWNPEQLKQRGVSVFWVDRGGDVTYHGPGQLVGYPIIPLAGHNHVGYIRDIEKMLIMALGQLGVFAFRLQGKTGVWVESVSVQGKKRPAKIAAIGVKVDAHGITHHGFALNVAPQMEYFDGIIPCGIAEFAPISMKELMTVVPSLEIIKRQVVLAFSVIFQMEIVQKGI